MKIVNDTIKNNKRIIFNGNNYSKEWETEAKKRGLPNLKSTVEALGAFIADKNVDLLVRHGIFTKAEIHSRYEIMLEDYSKAINIEALTMLDMAKREILPACVSYTNDILNSLAMKKASGLAMKNKKEEALAVKISDLTESLIEKTLLLDTAVISAKNETDALSIANFYRNTVFIAMQNLRLVADELETMVSANYWPYPVYSEILFNI